MITIPKLTLPDEYLIGIGEVVVSFNQLEVIMVICLLNLLEMELTSNPSHVIFANLQFNPRMDILSALIEMKLPDPNHELMRKWKTWVCPQLRNMQTKRNDIVHSFWNHDPDGVKTSSVAARGRLKVTVESRNPQELHDLSDEIVQAAQGLLDMVFAIMGRDPYAT